LEAQDPYQKLYKTESSHPASEGIYSSSMQFHGSANFYSLAGAETVAWLYADRESSAGYPAVVLNKTGNGITAAFAFDLARSIVYTRQGNPSFSDQDRDGHPFIRATDMFVGWLDLDRIAIPQADEQQRLFVKLIHTLSEGKVPLPRLWYFPGDIISFDCHRRCPSYGSAGRCDDVLKSRAARRAHVDLLFLHPS
jgi:hypothetical protein